MAKAEDIERAFKDALQKTLSKSVQEEIAKEMADTVRIRSQLGSGVSKVGGRKEKFKALSTKYVEQRKEFPGLSDKTTPRKSNVTRTGQMIDSLTGVGKSGGFEIKPEGRRDDGKTNERVAGYVEENGRPFLNFTDTELKKLTRLLAEKLSDLINKALGR